MKNHLIPVFTVAFLMALTTQGWAQPDQARQRPANPLFQLFDTNGDGVLSSSEIRAAADALRKLDADDDGEVTSEEFGRGVRASQQREGRDGNEQARRGQQAGDQQRRPGERGPGAPGQPGRPGEAGRNAGLTIGPNFVERIFQFDKDGDGKLSREELQVMVDRSQADRQDRAERGEEGRPPMRDRQRQGAGGERNEGQRGDGNRGGDRREGQRGDGGRGDGQRNRDGGGE
ncbi:MAG: hypothetical protein KF851_10190 [Pirellulaceae bacterium]|nr:hypothetical protein [Pirellulaceae bacterium]